MEEMWEYSGEIWIERVGDNAGGLIRLPWVVYAPIDSPLTLDQLEEIATQHATDFLNAFQTSDPERRAEFGEPTDFSVLSVLTLFR